MYNRIRSFKYAINGIIHCYLQPNMQIHALAAIIVILTGIIVHLSPVEWGLIILTIGLVKAAEAVNTAIEKMVDLVSPEKNENAGLIKDVAAGAVLITAIVAMIIAGLILLPKIIELLKANYL